MTDPPPVATIVEGVDIDALHAAIAACPGVSSVGGRSPAALTTYLPGRRVRGIRINADSVELEVVSAWETSAAQVVAQIRAAAMAFAVGRPIDITIADIDLPADDSPIHSPVAQPESDL